VRLCIRFCGTEEARSKGITEAMGNAFFKELEKEAFKKIDEVPFSFFSLSSPLALYVCEMIDKNNRNSR
jgi:hypothetical protein